MNIIPSHSQVPQMQEETVPINLNDFGPISLVVLQPTSFCNLDCDYCYLPERHLQKRLSLDLIEPIFQAIFTSPFLGDDFDICWHAGEPLTMPISFYEAAFAKIMATNARHNQSEFTFSHSFQTNGTLLTQAWCDFFKQHPVHVGVSLDGPAFLHDAHRQNRQGKGLHHLTMRGIDYLQANEISYSVIAVITEDSLDYPDEIFNFFVEHGISDVAFNFEETEGVNLVSSLGSDPQIEQRYRQFIQRIWDLTKQSTTTFSLREFEVLGSLIYTGDRLQNTEMNKPFAIVNFDTEGNFSTFDPELLGITVKPYGSFILGNVLCDSLASVCQSEKFLQIYEDLQVGVNQCRETCSYFGVCGGGSGSNKYWENGTFRSAQTQACYYSIQVLTDVIVDDLEKYLGLATS